MPPAAAARKIGAHPAAHVGHLVDDRLLVTATDDRWCALLAPRSVRELIEGAQHDALTRQRRERRAPRPRIGWAPSTRKLLAVS